MPYEDIEKVADSLFPCKCPARQDDLVMIDCDCRERIINALRRERERAEELVEALKRLNKSGSHDSNCQALHYFREAIRSCSCKHPGEIAAAHAEATRLTTAYREAGKP